MEHRKVFLFFFFFNNIRVIIKFSFFFRSVAWRNSKCALKTSLRARVYKDKSAGEFQKLIKERNLGNIVKNDKCGNEIKKEEEKNPRERAPPMKKEARAGWKEIPLDSGMFT